jgi:hypothetical protein
MYVVNIPLDELVFKFGALKDDFAIQHTYESDIVDAINWMRGLVSSYKNIELRLFTNQVTGKSYMDGNNGMGGSLPDNEHTIWINPWNRNKDLEQTGINNFGPIINQGTSALFSSQLQNDSFAVLLDEDHKNQPPLIAWSITAIRALTFSDPRSQIVSENSSCMIVHVKKNISDPELVEAKFDSGAVNHVYVPA